MSGNDNKYDHSVNASLPSVNVMETDDQEWSVLDERSPLLRRESRDLRSVSICEDGFISRTDSNRNLSTFAGVFSPVALSMFSTVLFLRLGFVIGQAGLLETLLQFVLAYIILGLTVLSICAISTNGAVEGGGAYFMISRALGPEFGGSIGLLFFLANVFACGLYISGFVEALTENFGIGGSIDLDNGLPVHGADDGKWWRYLYATVVLLCCLLVCLVGASLFARTSVIILLVVVVCIGSVIVSTFIEGRKCVKVPSGNAISRVNHTVLFGNHSHHSGNHSHHSNTTCPFGTWYTSYKDHTFQGNLYEDYVKDYTTGKLMDFTSVFAILFSSVTGIMNGANMSGELKEPGKSIPRGTGLAILFTFLTYTILTFIVSATSSRKLLQNNFGFLQDVNSVNWFVIIGIFATTLSAALGNLIGASRILEALARDEIFWWFLKPATVTHKGNPYVAVLLTWILVQVVLLIGSLNAIAPLVSVFFLLSYSATNLACLALDLASAPNFRPSFKYFSWHSSLVALIGCLVMCFLINAVFASVSVIVMMALVIVLHLRSMSTSWGSISQALIFHQVRKYLLLLDSRKDHVKFWRPQMLLLVSNPRACSTLIEFINDMKKGGLYILGHVKVSKLTEAEEDYTHNEYPYWLALIDYLKIKAFAEITVASSIREGAQHLMRIAGLGGMKPNTICLGFHDSSLPEDLLGRKKKAKHVRFYTSEIDDEFVTKFPDLRKVSEEKKLDCIEYVQIVKDALNMQKNVCLCRYFHRLDKVNMLKAREPMFIDVWPLNFLQPSSANYLDNTCLFLLQLACVLHMVPGWKKHTILRVFLCVDAQSDSSSKERKLCNLLQELRIPAKINVVTWEHVKCLYGDVGSFEQDDVFAGPSQSPVVPDLYLNAVNQLVRQQSLNTAVTFCYLPYPPTSDEESYLSQLDRMTEGFSPTVLVHGIHTVTSTTL